MSIRLSVSFVHIKTHIVYMSHISRHDVLRRYLHHFSIANDSGLECKILFETGDNVAGMVLLSKPHDGVEEKECTDDTEVDPVLQASGQESSNLHNIMVSFPAELIATAV